MNKHTPQEWADWTGCYVNQDKNGLWYLHKHKPELMLEEGYWNPQKGANDFEMNIFSILISAPADHNWTHLYEPQKVDNAPHQSEVFIHGEYNVVKDGTLPGLAAKVINRLNKGWKLQGGVTVEHLPISDGYVEDGPVFYQAMVRGL